MIEKKIVLFSIQLHSLIEDTHAHIHKERKRDIIQG